MKRFIIGGFTFLLLFLTACSSSSSQEDSAGGSAKSDDMSVRESAKMEEKAEMENNVDQSTKETAATTEVKATNRMVIYNAELNLEVKDFKKAQTTIESLVNQMAGYIVNAQIYDSEEGQMGGSITVRIPQDKFQTFLEKAEDISVKLHNRTVSGQDVTEEYVDLEARIKSKRAVEDRLLAFMKEAKETKDLLQISADLERVQVEIESLEGRMKYLENQTSLSTVTLTLFENKVEIPGIDKEELNTWEKTKKQFMDSINFLLTAFSGFLVFLLGNSPILLLLVIVGLIVWYVSKKVRRKGKKEQ
ncbi:DUF4349 domain-containing protein [Bacillus timonensis]|uniref:DUF4349 domain-containing protein n=1 Tax=Bacillus timonensis TaxID=1033734 RepID=UPI00028837F7|nr:DUF4349 domain-containing protein [Bacillus timonensis]